MEPTESVRGSIAERRAAKCGFNAAIIASTGPFESSGSGSPRLTIPPGISPTALLDSPIMLLDSQELPSPTTGTFPVSPLNHGTEGNDSVFRLRPPARPDSLTAFSSSENQGTDVDYQTLVPAHLSRDFKFPSELPNEATSKNCSEDLYGEVKFLESTVPAQNSGIRVCSSYVASDQISCHKPINGEDLGTHHRPSEGDQKGTYSSMEISRASEDGYNWRKYGQKQVKGSEYPRSYYKCTHPNCQVKKKVERSHDGQITEIIYKSTHNHPKPQPSRRATLGLSYSFNDTLEVGEGSGSCAKAEGGAVWRNIQMGSNWKVDGLENTSSASVLTEISDPSSTSQVKGVFDSAGTPELVSTLASPDDDEDESNQGSISLANDDDADSKRRKTESYLMETTFASRAVREPKVVVQIESEVDILDDGYRWRKYGQKVVKGNPNPRSYYKCTSAGCMVRKHVERASHNLKCVLTTYEGKHNHEVPAARNSNNGGNIAATNALARSNIPKPEAQVEGFASRYDRKYELSNEYLRSGLLANYGNEMKFSAASMYHQMKLAPPLQQTMCYGSFGLNPIPNQRIRQQVMVPDFPMSLPLSMHQIQSANSSIGPECYLSGPVLKESDMRFLRPKQEPIVNNANPPSSLYGRIFPS